jgi:hypothetical protein
MYKLLFNYSKLTVSVTLLGVGNKIETSVNKPWTYTIESPTYFLFLISFFFSSSTIYRAFENISD